jgi:chromosomal replication initiation ATPase DnaA
MTQIALPLGWPPDPRDDAFLVGPSNAAAVRLLDGWSGWPVMTAVLTGPRKSGRSLLARIFAAKSGGTIIDDAERMPEAALFHAWNRAQAEGRPTVIVAEALPPQWAVSLPDLRSRAASPHAAILPPDDDLMRALLQHQFDRRHLDARADLVDWLARRIPRSHLGIERVVDLLDTAATEARKRLSIALARATLASAGMIASAMSPEEA